MKREEEKEGEKEDLLSRRFSCSPVKEDGIGRRRERRTEGERDRSAVGVMWKGPPVKEVLHAVNQF